MQYASAQILRQRTLPACLGYGIGASGKPVMALQVTPQATQLIEYTHIR